MTTSGFWAYGSKLQMGDGATSEAFSDIAEITKLGGLDMKRDTIDYTSHDSANGYREKGPGLRDAGDVTFEGNWIPANATHNETTGLVESFNDNVNHNWKIVLPSAVATIALTGFLSALKLGPLDVDGKGMISGTIACSGKPVLDTTP
jgi:predicted secreted protein